MYDPFRHLSSSRRERARDRPGLDGGKGPDPTPGVRDIGADDIAPARRGERQACGAAVKNFTAAHATCVQNSIFAENCMSRAVPAPVIVPAVVLLMSMSPKSQFTVSNRLKISARSSKFRPAVEPHALRDREIRDELRRSFEDVHDQRADFTRSRIEEDLAVESLTAQRVRSDQPAGAVDDVGIDEIDVPVLLEVAEQIPGLLLAEGCHGRLTPRATRAIERAAVRLDAERRAALPFDDRGQLPSAGECVDDAAVIEPSLSLAEWKFEDPIRIDDVPGVINGRAIVEFRSPVVEYTARFGSGCLSRPRPTSFR